MFGEVIDCIIEYLTVVFCLIGLFGVCLLPWKKLFSKKEKKSDTPDK